MMIESMVVCTVAIAFITMGLTALGQPALVMRLVGISELTADLRNEIRAVYGGFGVALGSLMLWSIGKPELVNGVRVAAAASLLGMAGGRVIGWCNERTGRWPIVFCVVETIAGAGLLLIRGFA